jgi:hypothetical protein
VRVSFIGPLDFSIKGKYPDADAVAEAFIDGMIQGLPRYTTIIGGGQDEGVDKWVRHSFDLYKDKKSLHLTEYAPQHIKDKPWHELDWITRAKSIVQNSEKMFAVLPEEYNSGPESDILAMARGTHLSHTIVFLSPRGDVANFIEVKPKDTFIPVQAQGAPTKEQEVISELPASRANSERNGRGTRKGDGAVLQFRFTSGSPAPKRKPRVRKKVHATAVRTPKKNGSIRNKSVSPKRVRAGSKTRSKSAKLGFKFKK